MSRVYYGGQAVIEGVLIRGRTMAAVAVRAPDGQVIVREIPLNSLVYRSGWARLPFLRGLVALWDALVLGTRALMWSADVAARDEEGDGGFEGPLAWGTLVLSLLVGLGLFVLLPSLVAKGLDRWGATRLVIGVVEGLIRLVLVVGYIALIGRSKEVARVFAYHGAEHKVINACEAGAPLTPESVQRFSRYHLRCGTSFLLYVVLISILLFSPVYSPNVLLHLASRVVLVPAVAMVAYELIRLSAARPQSPVLRPFIVPGLWLQGLTTREPTLDMVEVAVAALRPVLAADGHRVGAADTAVSAAAMSRGEA